MPQRFRLRSPGALWALWAKEWSQHARAVATLTIFFALIGLVAWFSFLKATRSISVLEIVPRLAMSALPAAALVLGHRLVVAEYYGRTQRFLEALPLRRGQEAAVKLLFGFFWLALWGLATLVAALALAAKTEPIEPRFAGLLAVRLLAYTAALWAAVFLFNVFGRLRLPLLVLAGFVLVLLTNAGGVDLQERGPLALVDPATYVVERNQLPRAALVGALLVTSACVALALLLVSLREGGIVEMLAKPLSTREKGALLVVVISGAIAATSIDQRKSATLREDESVWPKPGKKAVEVVADDETLRPAAVRLEGLLTPVVARLADILSAPPRQLRIVHGSDVDFDRSETVARLKRGTLVRVNLQTFAPAAADEESREVQLRALADVFHVLLVSSSEGRALLEPRHFWADGFAQFLATQALDASPLSEIEALLTAQATGAPTTETVRAHHSFGERVGEGRAMALAGAAWSYVHERWGADKVSALARALFSRRIRGDLRDFLSERWNSPEAALTRELGLPLSAFVADWQRQLRERAKDPRHAERLARDPRASIDVRAQPATDFDPVVLVGNFTAPLNPQATCQALHMVERWFDSWPSPEQLQSETVTIASDRRGFRHTLDGDYESGERAFVAVDCRVPGLPGRTRLVATRVTIP